ncbi:PaaI family thioesterase [Palleronia caenipelagi]|uniref:PaaI family thioesterase n=1 Tax=Palleronia caenipelagi TaxID=2489174 RepID=A0A547PQK0_9RHOB|nr:PaaI family thioesterase [Palleronia caenipelagi]TRD16410.1 PaaI family thioesterase [Palleronia caenipelagi]
MHQMTIDELHAFMRDAFPQVADEFVVEELRDHGLVVRQDVHDRHLRPGRTISGPTMFGLTDVAIYLAILSRIGPVALAVTTNCSIDFMHKPGAGLPLRADARILKLGRQLAVGDVLIRSGEAPEPVARASLTYAIPPRQA